MPENAAGKKPMDREWAAWAELLENGLFLPLRSATGRKETCFEIDNFADNSHCLPLSQLNLPPRT
jgi:hypothetical protein